MTDGDHGIDRQPGAMLRALARVRHTSDPIRGRSPPRTQLIKAALRNSPARRRCYRRKTSSADLDAMHKSGIRGVRINLVIWN